MFVLDDWHIPGTDKAFYIPNFISQEEEELLIGKILDTPVQKWKRLANRRLQLWGGELTSTNVLIPQEMPSFIGHCPDIIARLRETGAFRGSCHGGPNHVILNEYLPGQGIMPHEDGQAYHPVVATISLASHSVFHYHRHRDLLDDREMHTLSSAIHNQPAPGKSGGDRALCGSGQSIDQTPVLSVFLEPRSLIITTSSLYTSHLHGIQGLSEDIFPPLFPDGDERREPAQLSIANLDLLGNRKVRKIIQEGGSLPRGTRFSLTCRDVEKVSANAKRLLKYLSK